MYEEGYCKWYDPRRKFGFIRRKKKKDIFFHRSAFSEDIKRLYSGDKVRFQVIHGDKGLKAVHIVLLARGKQYKKAFQEEKDKIIDLIGEKITAEVKADPTQELRYYYKCTCGMEFFSSEEKSAHEKICPNRIKQ